MQVNTKHRFRCIGNPRSIFTPPYMHDVIAMRSHPEYVEIDENDNVVTQAEESVGRVPISVNATQQPKKRVQLRRAR
jgi:hypothetical protein